MGQIGAEIAMNLPGREEEVTPASHAGKALTNYFIFGSWDGKDSRWAFPGTFMIRVAVSCLSSLLFHDLSHLAPGRLRHIVPASSCTISRALRNDLFPSHHRANDVTPGICASIDAKVLSDGGRKRSNIC